ncbi:hypothetical protein NQ315_016455 [Exocentrus adspersus]|uniref:Survival of motor neuron-related-splicing factor 30 n=1 Tax=Exocentrus adspersus TaxID=1586481 RepID=A0AAV8VYG7_9CUCU|nr:hypothetical protein NQ315_016455 [Exocentrus adspersus]
MTSILGPEWNISSEGINIITENGTIKNYNKVLGSALNTDLKEIGNPILSKELIKENTSKLVLQIQKIRNISAPKANEESQAAPRMLKLILTDGDSNTQALEISTINSISRNHTPPGTKLLINNAAIVSGYILLDPTNCSVLGGKVPHLVEKWEIAKSIQRNKRRNSATEGGPPPWVNFGMKIQTGNQDSNFKSLGAKSKEIIKDNTEFELQRQGAIAEATAGAVRKVFGGRVKQNVQPAVNNQNKPNKNYQEKNKNKARTGSKEKDVEEKPVKPSEKVSLFAFLEDKLPLNENHNTAAHANFGETQNYIKNQSINANKYNDIQTKPSPQNYRYPIRNQQNYNDKFPSSQSKYERDNVQQNINQGNYSDKYSNSPRQLQYNKEESTNNVNPRQYEKAKQQNRTESGSFNKPPQNNYNTQRDINDLSNNVNKMSLNSEFASRSLRQHLNLSTTSRNGDELPRNESTQNHKFNIGDECMAKYWEDGKFYNAIITAITDKTYAVKFKGYGNIEEILKSDCSAVRSNNHSQNHNQYLNRRQDHMNRPYSGSVEFRRSNRNYN